MKKVIAVFVSTFVFLAVSVTVLFTSCQKKNSIQPTGVSIKKTRVESGRKYKVYYGIYQPAMGGGFTCAPSFDICHIVKYYEQDGEPFNVYIDYGGEFKPMRMATADPADPLHDPVVIHPDTYLPAEFKVAHNIVSGQIQPGVYPVIYDAANPMGYVDLPYQP